MPFVDGDCTSCHQEPKETGGAPTLNDKGFALCATCHGDFPEKYQTGNWVHAPAKAGECLSCHTPHAGRAKHLIARQGPGLCTDCHGSIAKELVRRVVHAPVRSGNCTGCHSPHTSENKHGLVKAGADLCFTCHAALKELKRGASVHAPFDSGDCDSCHNAHASESASLLKESPNALCRTCHDPSDAALATAHRNFPPSALNCVSCHNPHGSSQPHLIRSKPHAVFTGCARCHEAKGPKPQALQTSATELCYRCHSPMKVIAQKPDAHKALAGGCVTCHNPHTADEPGLVKGKERDLCLSCHTSVKDTMAKSLSIHPLKAKGGRCTICHEPHQSGRPALLRSDVNAVCSACHKGHNQFGHPVGSNVVDPRTQKPMTCLSCHNPHGTQQRSLLRQDPQRGLCLECHAGSDTMEVLKGAGR